MPPAAPSGHVPPVRRASSAAPASWLTTYLAAVYVAGLTAVTVALALSQGYCSPLSVMVLVAVSALLLVSELRPIEIWRQESASGYTFSGAFCLVLVLCGPLWWALAAQTAALLLEELRGRKPLRVAAFNIAQHALTILAARAVFCVLTSRGLAMDAHPFVPHDLPAAVLTALTYFGVNATLTGIVLALAAGEPVVRSCASYVCSELSLTPVLLCLSPLMVIGLSFSIWTVPLIQLPVEAIRRSARLAAEREIRSLHDGLTGLPNRDLLVLRTTRALDTALRTGRPSALLLLDLDHFKDINDTLGHRVGDELLRIVGARLAAAVPGTATVARLGGDEFGILLPETAGPQAVAAVVERLMFALAEPVQLSDIVLDVRASVGIAMAPADATQVSELLQRADVAMYEAKERRGGYEFYRADRDRHTPERLALMGELRRGLDHEIVVHYQPQQDGLTGAINAVEALVRWQHPERGLLYPDVFISAAENTGLIAALTFVVLHQALAQLRAWRDEGLDLSMSVNISAQHLADLDLPRKTLELLAAYDLPGSALTLEVTESSIMADPVRAESVLTALRRSGIQVAIDDFGTGYSSLAYLKRLDVDELKIDRSFTRHMTDDAGDATIVRSTIELGHNLGLRVVAEGVEDEATARALLALGCDVLQGYWIGRPVPADRLRPLLTRSALAGLAEGQN